MASTKGRLEARVKKDYPYKFVRAFSGYDYTDKVWSPVPKGAEEEAKNHPHLDTRAMQSEPKDEAVRQERPKMPPIGGAGHENVRIAQQSNVAESEMVDQDDAGEGGDSENIGDGEESESASKSRKGKNK